MDQELDCKKRKEGEKMSFLCFILKLLFPHMELPGYAYVKTVVCGILRCGFKSPAGRRQDVKKTVTKSLK